MGLSHVSFFVCFRPSAYILMIKRSLFSDPCKQSCWSLLIAVDSPLWYFNQVFQPWDVWIMVWLWNLGCMNQWCSSGWTAFPVGDPASSVVKWGITMFITYRNPVSAIKKKIRPGFQSTLQTLVYPYLSPGAGFSGLWLCAWECNLKYLKFVLIPQVLPTVKNMPLGPSQNRRRESAGISLRKKTTQASTC